MPKREKKGSISIVVEYMDGGSLQDIVDTGGCQTEDVLANISYRVLQGLAFIHDRKQGLSIAALLSIINE